MNKKLENGERAFKHGITVSTAVAGALRPFHHSSCNSIRNYEIKRKNKT
jgi:hypothetical protein